MERQDPEATGVTKEREVKLELMENQVQQVAQDWMVDLVLLEKMENGESQAHLD